MSATFTTRRLPPAIGTHGRGYTSPPRPIAEQPEPEERPAMTAAKAASRPMPRMLASYDPARMLDEGYSWLAGEE